MRGIAMWLSLVATSHVVTTQLRPVESQSPPFVMVQAVDETWSPLPGAQVVLQEQNGNRATHRAVTNAEGVASFRLAPPDRQQYFDISASLQGFKKGEMKDQDTFSAQRGWDRAVDRAFQRSSRPVSPGRLARHAIAIEQSRFW